MGRKREGRRPGGEARVITPSGCRLPREQPPALRLYWFLVFPRGAGVVLHKDSKGTSSGRTFRDNVVFNRECPISERPNGRAERHSEALGGRHQIVEEAGV